MSDFFNDALSAISGDEFDEVPVRIEEFVKSEEYLGLPPLSENQYKIIKAGSQIYSLNTLKNLYGEEEGEARFRETYNEVILALGKGSGKDYCASILCAYVVYLLLCLKDPQKYFGKPPGDDIVIMNIAINAHQANRVFFKGLVQRIKNCPWFDGKYEVKSGEILFDKYVMVVSGHSESESLEGYNVLVVVLDEISGFALESNTGNAKAKTAGAIYEMHRASVTSRFPKEGKVVLLSFPRFKGDFISQRYDDVVAQKEVIIRKHTFKRNPDLPDGDRDNEFTVEWEEDHIIRYKYPRMFAFKRPSWEVNPTKEIDDYTMAFDANEGDALTRFACMPTANTDDALFKNHDKIDETFVMTNGVDDEGVFLNSFIPNPDTTYYMHVDLAQKHDRCVVAMAHVAGWKEISIGSDTKTEYYPIVHIDAIRWWQPTAEKSVEFSDVVDYILSVRRRGFNIGVVTFDRWNSHDTRNILERAEIPTDNLSVGDKHYADFKIIMHDDRLLGPDIAELKEELKALMWIKGKVDHPRSGYKDLSDGSCGAIYNAVGLTERPTSTVVDTETMGDVKKQVRKETERDRKLREQNVIHTGSVKSQMPESMRAMLAKLI